MKNNLFLEIDPKNEKKVFGCVKEYVYRIRDEIIKLLNWVELARSKKEPIDYIKLEINIKNKKGDYKVYHYSELKQNNDYKNKKTETREIDNKYKIEFTYAITTENLAISFVGIMMSIFVENVIEVIKRAIISNISKKGGEIELYSSSNEKKFIEDNVNKIYVATIQCVRNFYRYEIGIDIFIANILSSMGYEKRENKNTGIVFGDFENNKIIEINGVKWGAENSKAIRKLLEMTFITYPVQKGRTATWKMLNYSNGEFNGIVFLKMRVGKFSLEGNYWMYFCPGGWKLYYGKQCLICYLNGQYKVIVEDDMSVVLQQRTDIEQIGIKTRDLLMEIGKNSEHGALAVCFFDSADAENEKERLTKLNRGYAASCNETMESSIVANQVEIATKIDGAIFIDNVSGKIVGCGMILDGKAVKGDNARGSRYNSSKAYIAKLKEEGCKAIAVVFSEDSGFEIISMENL